MWRDLEITRESRSLLVNYTNAVRCMKQYHNLQPQCRQDVLYKNRIQPFANPFQPILLHFKTIVFCLIVFIIIIIIYVPFCAKNVYLYLYLFIYPRKNILIYLLTLIDTLSVTAYWSNLKSPINSVCFWTVGGSRSTCRKPAPTQKKHINRSHDDQVIEPEPRN